MKSKIFPLLMLFAILVGACVPESAAVTPTLAVTAEPLPTTISESPAPEDVSASNAWKVLRDERHGFGLAVPCWWLTSPASADGINTIGTIKNYDDNYFNAHSSKGFWDWPNGALKLDIVIMEGIDPAKSDADAYMQFVDSTMSGLVSAEAQQTGAHTATVLTLANLVNTNDPNSRIFVYRPAADKLLMIVPIPQTIIDTPDFQALLASIALTSEETVSLPVITPAPALIDASCAQ